MGKVKLKEIIKSNASVMFTVELPINNDKHTLRCMLEHIYFFKHGTHIPNNIYAFVIKNKIHCIFDGNNLICSLNSFNIINNEIQKQTKTVIPLPTHVSEFLTINNEKML